ncbi:MAG: ABC transporter permease [bacterium]|nr:ABC transporter permease [bacterium]
MSESAFGTIAQGEPEIRGRISVPRPIWQAPLLPIGIASIFIGTMVLNDATAEIRVLLVLVGIAGAYLGLDAICQRRWGAGFDTSAWLSGVWLVMIGLSAILVQWLPLPESKLVKNSFDEGLRLRPDLFSRHPLGTNSQELDLLGGVMWGARTSLIISLGAVAIGLVIGGLIGIAAGYFRGPFDSGVGILADSLLAFPPLILLVAMATVFEQNQWTMALELSMLGIPTYIRLARANTLTFAQREFVLAAKAMGSGDRRVIFRELMPNVALPMVSYAFLVTAVLIVAEASLSFLGVGIQPPEPTWGNMIEAGQENYQNHPHLVFVPGIVMFMTVFALNRVGDKARERWDPREAQI